MSKYFLLILGLLFIAGCNTMEGLGEDIQHGGRALERNANQHK